MSRDDARILLTYAAGLLAANFIAAVILLAVYLFRS